jgi:hypothetical protein
MEEVNSFDWMQAPGMRSIQGTVHEPPHWTFFPETDGIVDASNIELIDENGVVFTPDILRANARRVLNEHLPQLPSPMDRTELRLRVSGQGLTLRNPHTGGTTPVKFGVLRIVYSILHTLSPHRRMRYADKANGKHIMDAVVSEFQVDDKTMRMVLVHKEEEGSQFYLTVAPSKTTKKRRATKKAIPLRTRSA